MGYLSDLGLPAYDKNSGSRSRSRTASSPSSSLCVCTGTRRLFNTRERTSQSQYTVTTTTCRVRGITRTRVSTARIAAEPEERRHFAEGVRTVYDTECHLCDQIWTRGFRRSVQNLCGRQTATTRATAIRAPATTAAAIMAAA